MNVDPSPLYRALGVRRVVNAADTYTDLGGPRLPDEVAEAMLQAGAHQVDVRELLVASGERIAELTRNPAALVVNGAAAGLAISAAAAIALRPGPAADAPEVLVLCCQRNPYDQAILAGGAVLRQVGHADSSPLDAVRAGLNDRTVAVLWFAGTAFERHAPALETMAELAHGHGVPLIVDAAAQFPPLSNLWSYRERGADVVIFSGGKGLKGPQSSGLLVGTREFIGACAAFSYPHHGVGRTMKTSKEGIGGLLAAIERAVALDWGALEAVWRDELEQSRRILARIDGLRLRVDPTGRLGQTCPRLFVSWDRDRFGFDAAQLADRLAAGAPSIRIGTGEGGDDTVHLNPYSLLPGERELVTDALLGEFAAVEVA